MNDQFLYGLRRQPAPELARAVYDEVRTHPGDDPLPEPPRTTATPTRAPRSRRRVLALAALATLFLFLVSAAFSPAVRAIVQDVVRRIGGQIVRETAVYPLSDDYVTLPDDNRYLSLAEARRAAAFDFSLPTRLPRRYVMLEEIIVGPTGDSVDVRWKGQETRGDGLWLRISPAEPDVSWVIGSGSSEIVDVDGREGLFIRGGWLENTNAWDPDISRDVRWVRDGLTYHLSTGGPFTCPDEPNFRCPLSDEDLIRIAASIE